MIKNKISLVTILFILFLTACSPDWGTFDPTGTSTPPETPTVISETPTTTPDILPTETDLPTATELPEITETPTDEPTASQTPDFQSTVSPTLVPDDLPVGNLLKNPSFEGTYHTWSYSGGAGNPRIFVPSVQLADRWDPYFCHALYVGQDAIDEGACRAKGVSMGLPEFKPSSIRVDDDETAQQWFCFSRPCDAGVSQQLETIPGVQYRVTAHFQIWSEDGWSPEDKYGNTWESQGFGFIRTGEVDVGGDELCDRSGVRYTSDTCTKDDRNAARVYITVDLLGDDFVFSESTLPAQREYRGYSDVVEESCYDKFCTVVFEFYANSTSSRVFFGAKFRYPFVHNDVYLDNVSVEAIAAAEWVFDN